MQPGDARVLPPEDPEPEPEAKFYMGTEDGKAPSPEEALKAGRALFDQIQGHRARTAEG
jgi:hypothetical protein